MSEQRWIPPAFNYSLERGGARVVDAEGEHRGRRGWVIGSTLELYEGGEAMKWVPILWDGRTEPDWHPAAHLKSMAWTPFLESGEAPNDR